MQPDTIRQHLRDHHKQYYGWALHCCGNDGDMVLDVLQTAYLKMMVKQTSFKEQSAITTWAFAIIKNPARDAKRKGRKERSIIKSELHLIDEGYSTEVGEASDERIRAKFFAEGLAQLTERQTEILQLVFYHDLSLKEVGQVLNISTGTVSRHYDRAKKHLVNWLHQNGVNVNNYHGLV